jgi:hypothetical protein
MAPLYYIRRTTDQSLRLQIGSLLLNANLEFGEPGWSSGDSNPGPLANQACATTFSFVVLSVGPIVVLIVVHTMLRD